MAPFETSIYILYRYIYIYIYYGILGEHGSGLGMRNTSSPKFSTLNNNFYFTARVLSWFFSNVSALVRGHIWEFIDPGSIA